MNQKNDKGKSDGRWKCPVCHVEADVKGRDIHVFALSHIWPSHSDCEFAQAIDSINFDKLERVA